MSLPLGALEQFLSEDGGEAPVGTVTAPPVKKDDKKPEGTPPADDKKPKPDDKKAATPPADDKSKAPTDDLATLPADKLRDRLKQLRTEKEKLEGDLAAAKSDKRIDELSKKLETNEKAMADRQRELDSVSRKLLIHNPLVNKRLVELRDKFNSDYKSTIEVIPELEPHYRALVDEFVELPRGKEGYAEKLKAFRMKLKEQFGDDAATAFEAVRKGHEFRQTHSKLADEISRDAEKIEFQERRKSWDESHSRIETEYPKWFEAPADAATTDPYHPLLFLNEFEKALDPKESSKVNNSIRSYVDRVFNGVQPRTKDDFPGMDDEGVQAELDKLEARVEKDRASAPALFARTLKIAAYFRPLIADIQRLRGLLKEKESAAPPDPTKNPGTTAADKDKPDGGNGADNLLEYEPPTPAEVAAGINE